MSITRAMLGAAIAVLLTVSATEQASADPSALAGLDAATMKKVQDSHAKVRSPQLEAALEVARAAQLAAMERDPPDYLAYFAAVEREKEISANILSRRLDAELNAFESMSAEERKAYVAAERKLREQFKSAREKQKD